MAEMLLAEGAFPLANYCAYPTSFVFTTKKMYVDLAMGLLLG